MKAFTLLYEVPPLALEFVRSVKGDRVLLNRLFFTGLHQLLKGLLLSLLTGGVEYG